jgi:phosphate transport system protein
MERHFDQELDHIRQELLRMAGLVETMIADAMQALVERDQERATGVIVADKAIDLLEIQLDEACHALLVRRQPAAVDLRLLVAIMKINSDLERMGDSAVNIAQSVEQLLQLPPHNLAAELPHLSRLVQMMVRDSLDSFVHRDAALARSVCARDDEVDGLYKQMFRELLDSMVADPRNVGQALHLLLIARNLERIADHATNVCEDVIYYVEGQDVRHPLAKMG